LLRAFIAGLSLSLAVALTFDPADAAEKPDPAPRTAVMSAFRPELIELQTALQQAKRYDIHGIAFETGIIEGTPVVLF
jgi:adenosylhomocysteine nucleosidase